MLLVYQHLTYFSPLPFCKVERFSLWHPVQWKQKYSDQCQYLINFAPTSPLTQLNPNLLSADCFGLGKGQVPSCSNTDTSPKFHGRFMLRNWAELRLYGLLGQTKTFHTKQIHRVGVLCTRLCPFAFKLFLMHLSQETEDDPGSPGHKPRKSVSIFRIFLFICVD